MLAAAFGACVPGRSVIESPRLQISERVLHGDRPAVECIWLTGADGQVTFIELPLGWTATFGPLVILDEQGTEVAREGDRVEARANEFTTVGETVCGAGVPLVAEQLNRVGP
jgi:hypothetical protein